MKKLLSFLLAVVISASSFSQADCFSANTICGNTQPFNPSGVGTKLEQLACGGIEHNSVWIAFQAKASGKLNFVVRPFTLAGLPTVVDVDWSLYLLAGAPGVTNCNNKTQLSCNFAGSSTVFGIPGATGMASPPFTASQFNPGIDVTLGNWYVLMIDQFSNTTPILFSVQFTGNIESDALNSTPGIFNTRPDFSITTASACSGIYNFTNSSSAVAGIASYSWNFGDGSTSTAANPTKTYATPGIYYVTLTVTDNNGCKSDIRKQVTFNITPPTVNTASLFVTPSCSDANNGTLTVVTAGATNLGVTGGTPPYSFELVSPSAMIRAAQSSPTFTGLQPGGYILKVTDACARAASGTAVTISQVTTNSNIGLGIQNTQAACSGSASGSATIFANGTTPPYTMALVSSSPVTTAALPAIQRDPITATYYTTFTGLLPGTYTVEAVDACGKIRRATFTLAASTAPTANTVASPSCAASATGTLTVTATAATGLSANGAPGTFQYALIAPSPITRPFQNGSVFENLFPGTYSISVRDVCGNIGTATATVGTAVAPNFGTSFTTSSCPNGSTGTIEVQNGTAAGGGSPYSYELVPPSPLTRPAQANNTFGNLPPGTYTVRLTDVCSTQASTTVTVAASVAPTFTTAITASCSATASGTITITPAAAALGPFSFELISPGAAIRVPQGSNIANTFNSIFTSLNQGAYTIKMTDGCGTPVTNTATVTAPVTLSFPLGSVAVPTCASPSAGQITVALPTSGLGAYKYELIAPSPVTRAPQYSRLFNALPAGNYIIRITDSCGAQVDNSATPLTLAVATAPAVTATNTSSCATSSGTITCLATNTNQGGGTYQFALIAPSPVTRPNQASPIFTGLPAGLYTVQVTDQCGQTGTTTTTIAAAGAFSPTAGVSVVSCSGSNYYAQIIVTTPQNFTTGGPIPAGSGGGPYSFAVYDAGNTTLIAGPQASNVFSTIVPIAATPSHTIRVTDVCGNTSTTTVTANPPAALVAAAITATTASCAASSTGVIKVTTISTGGLTPYRYSLIDAVTLVAVAGPQTSTTFNAVPANATGYLVRTTEACGNVVTSATALLFPAAVAPTATAATTASCATPASGVITVSPGTGATLAGGTFSFALYDAANTTLVRATQTSPVFGSVAAATYTVRITDGCASTGTTAATVASGGVGIPTATGTATGTCTGGSTGVVVGASSGGTLPITYSLVNQVTSTVVAGPQADVIFASLANGTYIVRVTDACGTITNSANIVLGDFATAPTISSTTALDCAGFAQIGAYGGGGSGGPYTYAICSGAGCSSFGEYSASSTFTVGTSDSYRVSVKDRCGNLISSSDIAIVIPPKPSITGVTKANACGTTTFTVGASGVPNTPYYSVDGANFSPTLPSLNVGCHTVRVADYNAGVFGCSTDTFNISVFDLPTLRTASPANGWVVNCATANVTPALTAATGNTGCISSGGILGVRLEACTGCTAGADPIGTVRAAGTPFVLPGATSASFKPAIIVGGTEVCSGSTVSASFTVAPFTCSYPLPITIEYFNGMKQAARNVLSWKLNCYNSPHMQVSLERSATGLSGSFQSLYNTNMDAAACLQPFGFTDALPFGGINYYRLAITDANGTLTYSRIISLWNANPAFDIVNILPNPVKFAGDAILNITSSQTGNLKISVTDLRGKSLLTKTAAILAGDNQVRLNVSALSAGVYQVTCIAQDGTIKRTRFVKE